MRRKAKPVDKIDADLQRTVQLMFQTMYAEPGIGLAGPQVGISQKIIVMDVPEKGRRQPLVLINPKMEEKRGRIKSEEGCLSFPGISVTIPRAEWVRFTALNEKGMPIQVAADGLLSRCLQHEFDHLNGALMIDHLPVHVRLKVLWDIRKRKKAGVF